MTESIDTTESTDVATGTPAPQRSRYTTATILTAVALGAAVGVVIIPLNFASATLTATVPVLAVAVYGIWGMSALLPLALLRRPGVGVIGAAAAGVVSSLSPYGLQMVVMMLVWGVLMEAPFAVLRYRRWGRGAFLVAGVVTGVVSTAMSAVQLHLSTLSTPLMVTICAVQLASFVLCSWASYELGRVIARSGVVAGRRA